MQSEKPIIQEQVMIPQDSAPSSAALMVEDRCENCEAERLRLGASNSDAVNAWCGKHKHKGSTGHADRLISASMSVSRSAH